MYRLEDSHWWFVARRDLLKSATLRQAFESRHPVAKVTRGSRPRLSCSMSAAEPAWNDWIACDRLGQIVGLDLEPRALGVLPRTGLATRSCMASATVPALSRTDTFDAADCAGCPGTYSRPSDRRARNRAGSQARRRASGDRSGLPIALEPPRCRPDAPAALCRAGIWRRFSRDAGLNGGISFLHSGDAFANCVRDSQNASASLQAQRAAARRRRECGVGPR